MGINLSLRPEKGDILLFSFSIALRIPDFHKKQNVPFF